MDAVRVLERLRTRLRQVGRERVRERQLRLPVRDRIRELRDVARLHAPRPGDELSQRSLDEPSEAAADDRLAIRGRAPGKADAGSEVRLLRVSQTLRQPGLGRREDRRRRDRFPERGNDLRDTLVEDDHCAMDAHPV